MDSSYSNHEPDKLSSPSLSNISTQFEELTIATRDSIRLLDSVIVSNTLLVCYSYPPNPLTSIIYCISPLIYYLKASNLCLSPSISSISIPWGGIPVNFGVNFVASHGYAILTHLRNSSGTHFKNVEDLKLHLSPITSYKFL